MQFFSAILPSVLRFVPILSLFQEPEIVVCFPKYMIRQQRKNDRTYITLGNPFCTCRFKIAVLFCSFQCYLCHFIPGSAVLPLCLLQQPAVIFRKSIRRIDQFTFRRCSLPRSPKALQILPGTGRFPAGMLLPFPEIQPEERTRALS